MRTGTCGGLETLREDAKSAQGANGSKEDWKEVTAQGAVDTSYTGL